MKTKVFFIILGTCILFSSCKKNKKDIIIINEEETIKKTIENKENSIFWTEAYEENILTEAIITPEILENIPLSVGTINAVPGLVTPIYPEINELGSLDNSDISKEVVTFVNRICNQIKNDPQKNMEQFFDENYIFNYVFFRTDLKDNWEKLFHTKYPSGRLFNKFYAGRINEGFDLTQVVCRFYTDINYIDITLFISQNEKKLNLKQIEINWDRS